MENTLSTEQTPQDEFAAAFAEIAAARNKTEAQDATPAPTPAPAPAAEPAAPAPSPTAAAPAPQAADARQQELTPEDRLAELERKLQEAQHRERSSAQRVSAFHRKYNEAEARIRELTEKLQGAAAPAAAPVPASPQEDTELQELLRQAPEIGQIVDRLVAKKVAESVGTVQQQMQKVEQGIQPLRERAEQQAVQAELAQVEREFPNWRDIVFTEQFEQWTETLPPSLRTAYANAATAQDAIQFLRMYQREQPSAAAPAATATQAAPQGATNKQARLERAVGVPSRPAAGPVGGIPAADDFEGAFQYFAKRRATATN